MNDFHQKIDMKAGIELLNRDEKMRALISKYEIPES